MPRRIGLVLALAVLLTVGLWATPAWSLDAEPIRTPVPETIALEPSAADLEAGGHLFEAHCVGCHVGGGNVIRRGRTLKLEALQRADLASPEAIARIAAEGQGQMSGYAAVLGDQGARQLGVWVWQQAQAGWPRPHRSPSPA
ncbi:MAG: c-type cytochrome [Synechococcus sp. ELA057]